MSDNNSWKEWLLRRSRHGCCDPTKYSLLVTYDVSFLLRPSAPFVVDFFQQSLLMFSPGRFQRNTRRWVSAQAKLAIVAILRHAGVRWGEEIDGRPLDPLHQPFEHGEPLASRAERVPLVEDPERLREHEGVLRGVGDALNRGGPDCCSRRKWGCSRCCRTASSTSRRVWTANDMAFQNKLITVRKTVCA